MKTIILIIAILLLQSIFIQCFGQVEGYTYKPETQGGKPFNIIKWKGIIWEGYPDKTTPTDTFSIQWNPCCYVYAVEIDGTYEIGDPDRTINGHYVNTNYLNNNVRIDNENSEEYNVLKNTFEPWFKRNGKTFSYQNLHSSFFLGNDTNMRILENICSLYPIIAMDMGIAFKHRDLELNREYKYKIYKHKRNGCNRGQQIPMELIGEIKIKAGVPNTTLLPAPKNVFIIPGDCRLDIQWDKPNKQYPVNIKRLGDNGVFEKINVYSIVEEIDDLKNPLKKVMRFIDKVEWDSIGNPTKNKPAPGIIYTYKVSYMDYAGNDGPSVTVTGKAYDSIAPRTPENLFVKEVDRKAYLSWISPQNYMDEKDHKEFGKIKYSIIKCSKSAELNSCTSTILDNLVPVINPFNPNMLIYSYTDENNPIADCGDSTIYYRISAVDESGNHSPVSVFVPFSLRDNTPPLQPGKPGVTGLIYPAESDTEKIKISWDTVSSCDVSYYSVYMAVGHQCVWVRCLGHPLPTCDNDFLEVERLYRKTIRDSVAKNPNYRPNVWVRPDSSASDQCLVFRVKAFDFYGNMSGEPLTKEPPTETIVCARLRDRHPPEPAIITGLQSMPEGIKVSFIGQPVKDIRAYYIFRSANEKEGKYEFIGGIKVQPQTEYGKLILSELTDGYDNCDVIPRFEDEKMSKGEFLDTFNVIPRKIYWYKVIGVDFMLNKSDTSKSTPASNFTFTMKKEAKPKIVKVIMDTAKKFLKIKFTPLFEDKLNALGFVIFRSLNSADFKQQIGDIVKGNEYDDYSVIPNFTYWYSVAILKKDGSVSNLSDPVKGVWIK